MAYPQKAPAQFRFDECNHVETILLDSPRALRLKEPPRG